MKSFNQSASRVVNMPRYVLRIGHNFKVQSVSVLRCNVMERESHKSVLCAQNDSDTARTVAHDVVATRVAAAKRNLNFYGFSAPLRFKPVGRKRKKKAT